MDIPAHLGYLAKHVPMEPRETPAQYVARLEANHRQFQESEELRTAWREAGLEFQVAEREESRSLGHDYEEAVERMQEDVTAFREYMSTVYTDDDIDEGGDGYPE
ncbi:MAG: hypothetical protein WBA46_12245 [Thermomicrobiales bacterium]